jgi:hypothetical protein
MAGAGGTFRVTYRDSAELVEVRAQMAHGGLLVTGVDTAGLELGAPVMLELVLPGGHTASAPVQVLHVFPGTGVAVSVTPALVAAVEAVARAPGATSPPPPAAAAPAPSAGPAAPNSADKIQLALHGNRDQRNAILRDPNRALHPYVLKNPQFGVDDALAVARNGQASPELLGLLGDRKEWLSQPQIALALAKNPKTPTAVAVRALDHVPVDALRHIAKGTGAPPLVVQAARRKVIK